MVANNGFKAVPWHRFSFLLPRFYALWYDNPMSARKIAYNTIAQVSGKFLGFFISSFFLIILAGHLGTTGMGYYTTVTAFVAFFVNLADLGINLVMMREIAQNPDKKIAITSNFLGFRFFYSLVIMALAPVIAFLIPQYGPYVRYGVGIAALAQFILLMNQTFVSVLQVSLKLDRAVFAEIINRAVTLGLVIAGAVYIKDMAQFFYFVLWVTVIASLVNAAISYFFANKEWSVLPKFNPSEWQKILVIVLPMGVFSFLSMVHFKSDTIILSLLKPAYDVGIYGYAYKIGEIMFSIPMMFIGIVFPQMSALYKNNKQEFLDFTQKVFDVLLFVTFPFVVGVYLLAPYFTTLLSRQSLQDGLIAGEVLKILSLAMVVWFFGALYQHILLAGTSYKGLIRNITIAVVVNIALNLLFIPLYSYFAAAIITVVSEIIMLILTLVYVYQSTGFMARLRGLIPVLVGTVGMAICINGAMLLLGQSVIQFAEDSRLMQLIILMIYGIVGVVSYGAILALWGKTSPLYSFYGMLRKQKS